MDRSVAGRGAIGRLDRTHAPAVALRLPRLQLPLALQISAERAGAALRALWSRRRLRLAIIVLAVLAALTSAAWLWLRHSSLTSVRRVQITGVHGPQAAAIDAALTGAARHMSTLDVRLGALRAAVAPFAVVREVRASASFPHGLRIHVVEQLPVATLVAVGTRTALAADGVALGPSLVSGSLPTLSANSLPAPGERVSDEPLRSALTVIGAAPAAVARQIARAETGKQGLTLVMRNGLAAYFGDSSRPHAKWLALALVIANERSAGASYVDVRVPERAVAGFAPGTAPPSSGEGSSSAHATAEVGGSQESITASLAAGLAKAVGQEQATAPAAPAAGNSEGASGAASAQSGTTAAGEAPTSARSQSGAGAGAEAASESGKSGP